jgi:hypothetical protein
MSRATWYARRREKAKKTIGDAARAVRTLKDE